MRISLITVCFNSEDSIEKTLISVKNQNFQNFEHIIIDGNSQDNTIEIVRKFEHISKVVSEKDHGIYDAINKGIKISEGEIIGFLNSDDTFYDSNILKIISESFNNKTDCIFGNLIYTDKNEKIKRKWMGSNFKTGKFKKGWMPAHPTFYCRKEIYNKFGMYDDTYKIAGDFELMLRFLEINKIKSKYLPYTMVNMKIGGVSNSSIKNKIEILREEFRAFKENNLKINKLFYLFHKAKKLKEFNF